MTAADVFASNFGLLGLFHHIYSAPILPNNKLYVAPGAVIENERLRVVDPTTEGRELVAEAVNARRPSTSQRFTKKDYGVIAMPGEVRFATKERFSYPNDPSGRALRAEEYVPWEEARSGFDALFVLDSSRQTKSSVLTRSEGILAWTSALEDFPPPPYTGERAPYLGAVLNDALTDIAPNVVIGEHGQLALGWRSNTLLQAMYLMLFLDLIGGSQLRECASHDCFNYFRVGPQTNSKYCSVRHANRASTRRQRGKQP